MYLVCFIARHLKFAADLFTEQVKQLRTIDLPKYKHLTKVCTFSIKHNNDANDDIFIRIPYPISIRSFLNTPLPMKSVWN